jgi:hypothetical protein
MNTRLRGPSSKTSATPADSGMTRCVDSSRRKKARPSDTNTDADAKANELDWTAAKPPPAAEVQFRVRNNWAAAGGSKCAVPPQRHPRHLLRLETSHQSSGIVRWQGQSVRSATSPSAAFIIWERQIFGQTAPPPPPADRANFANEPGETIQGYYSLRTMTGPIPGGIPCACAIIYCCSGWWVVYLDRPLRLCASLLFMRGQPSERRFEK